MVANKSNNVKFLLTVGCILILSVNFCSPPFLYADSNNGFIQQIDNAIKSGIRSYESGLKLTESDKRYLLKATRTVLQNHFIDETKDMKIDDFHKIPPNISSQSEWICITLITEGRVRGCQSAWAGNLLENSIEAVYKVIADERFGEALGKEELDDIRIEFTILLDPIEVKDHRIKRISRDIELGVHAFRLLKDRKGAYFKSSVPISHGYNLEYALKRLGVKAQLGTYAYQDPEVKIYRYTTVNFAEHPQDKSLINIFRYNRLLYQSDVAKQRCMNALRLAGDYMANHVDEKGLITYEYDVYRDKRSSPEESIAVIRSLASVWMLASIGNYFKDNKYIDASKRSLDYFLNKYYVYDKQQDFGYIQVGDDINVGITSFALLGLIEINDEQYHTNKKKKIANFILAMEDKKEGFIYPVYPPKKDKNFQRKEVYYPGEALTAIMTLYESTLDPAYLAITERVFDYYRDLFDSCPRKASMVPWMSKAYAKAYFATGKRKYADFVFKMNDYILNYQKDIDEKYVDKIGSFFSNASCCSAGVFIEGIAEGYRVTKALNDKRRMKSYRRSILMGSRFILQCQYTENNMFTARNRNLTLGGIRTNIYTSSIRIDSIQHVACALLRILEHIYTNPE